MSGPTPRGPRPIHVALVVSLVAVVVMGLRLSLVCGWDPSCMLVAGAEFVDPSEAPIAVEAGDGYDGQFFYRQARSPFEFSVGESNGVRFDYGMRAGRIGYPLVVWALSAGGRATLVPPVMLAVNIVSIGAAAWVLAAAAGRADRSRWWGLAVLALPGLWFAAGRLVADPFAAALVGGGALAIRSRRWSTAAALLSVAVLTREQAIVVPIAYAMWCIYERIRDGEPLLGRRNLPWIAPAVVFVAWQGIVATATGSVPVLAAGGQNGGIPAVEMFSSLGDWITHPSAIRLLWLCEIVAIVALAVVVAAASDAQGWERIVAAATILLVASLNVNVFKDPSHFRQVADVSVVLLMAVMVVPPRRWSWIVGVNAFAGVGVAVALLRFL